MSYNLEQFKDGLKELQIELNEKQISQFLKYYELLVETNKVMNLFPARLQIFLHSVNTASHL